MYAIEVHDLSKVYRLYSNPKDRLKEYLFRGRRTYHQAFWALRNVSFRVAHGSTLGLVGDNGPVRARCFNWWPALCGPHPAA